MLLILLLVGNFVTRSSAAAAFCPCVPNNCGERVPCCTNAKTTPLNPFDHIHDRVITTRLRASSSHAITNTNFDSATAKSVIEEQLYPKSELDVRLDAGKNAQNLPWGEPIAPDDPRLTLTYAEFPLESFKQLLDRSKLELVDRNENDNNASEKKKTRKGNIVDVGSGTGRLALYAALTQGGEEGWNVHGVEISSELHNVAAKLLERATEEGIFSETNESTDTNSEYGQVHLHLGAADEPHIETVLKNADIIFMYSTVFSASDFHVELAALMLGPEWSQMLAKSCSNGCVVVTTDRILNPEDGFVLVDRMDVDNPELYGSTGYVHVLQK